MALKPPSFTAASYSSHESVLTKPIVVLFSLPGTMLPPVFTGRSSPKSGVMLWFSASSSNSRGNMASPRPPGTFRSTSKGLPIPFAMASGLHSMPRFILSRKLKRTLRCREYVLSFTVTLPSSTIVCFLVRDASSWGVMVIDLHPSVSSELLLLHSLTTSPPSDSSRVIWTLSFITVFPPPELNNKNLYFRLKLSVVTKVVSV